MINKYGDNYKEIKVERKKVNKGAFKDLLWGCFSTLFIIVVVAFVAVMAYKTFFQ